MGRKPREVKCTDCGKPMTVSYAVYFKNKKYGAPMRCRECFSKHMSIKSKEVWNNKTDEEKKKSLEGKNKYWNNLSEEDKRKIYDKRAVSIKKGWDNKSADEMKQVAETHKRVWNNMDEEMYNNIQQKKSSSAIKYWNNLSDKEKEDKSNHLSNINKEWRDNLTEDDKKEISLRCKKRWDDMSDEEKERETLRLKEIADEYRRNMTDEDRLMISNKKKEYWKNLPRDQYEIHRQHSIDVWNDKSDADKITHIRKIIGNKRNNFNFKFENAFQSLYSEYYIVPETLANNNSNVHSWDYGIYDKKNRLQMLIDLDGAYFHADICDYDGMHSHEEYDEKRGLSIPDGIKWCIINELNFNKSFEWMQNALSMNYADFIETNFRYLRNMPFPYPEYCNKDLFDSYRDLCKLDCDDKYHASLNINTRVGDRLIFHFMKSIWGIKRSDLSPIEAWDNDDVLRDMIKRSYLYHSYLNKNKILQGFNLYPKAQRVSILSAGKAKMIIHHYLSTYNEVFCPVHNLGIMLACISMNKRYITYCNDEVLLNETNNMLTFLHDNGIDCNVELNDVSENYQCLIAEVNNDNQIVEYLSTYKCKRYVFLTEYTEHCKDNIVDKFDNQKLIII